ncbi:Tetratricopeptide repeat domain-containing protein [Trichoderma barbatum]
MAASEYEQRDISNSSFGDYSNVYQGNVHLHLPHLPARAEVVRVIPYPRNEDLVYRQDLINKLNKLLPQTAGFYSAALWGLGGSGKTQIALDYAYQRCDDSQCCVFWVHADSEATFITDYKIIGKKLGVDERLDGSDLLDAVRSSIEAQPRWTIIIDNADDLTLFGVGRTKRTNESLSKYIPRGPQGTILWTSRDAHIAGTLVGSRRGIEVPSMTRDEATTLLVTAKGEKSAVEEIGIDRLLDELQRLPLAEYLDLLMQGTSRWDLLKMNDFNRHRRPEVSNSVLETWKISTQRIREESELSYRILQVIAYLDSQDISYELIVAVSQYDVKVEHRAEQVPEIEVQRAVMRLVEFSFLDMRRGEGGLRSYEMHKLVQEAVRYGLWVQGRMEMTVGKITTGQNMPENAEAYYSSMTLQLVDDMFPGSEKNSWAQCEKYVTHAIRVGEWAVVSRKEVQTSTLLSRREPVDRRVLDLRGEVLGEKHPDTIWSIADLAATYYAQGRYNEAEGIYMQALNLRQEVLGEKHPDTIRSRYDEAKGIYKQALDLRREVLGEKHPDTIWSMASLATIYHAQGRYDKTQGIHKQALDLRREVLGEKHPDTIWSMASLATKYYAQGRYDEAEGVYKQALDLRREVLGEKHPNTIRSMANLAITYHAQGRYDKAEGISKKALDLRQEVHGEKHPDTIRSMADLAATYGAQGRS